MYRIEHNDKVYEGATEKELYLQLRKRARLTYREIAKLVNKSKQWVSQVLGPQGKLEFPELNDPRLFFETDSIIAMKLGVPISRVAAARRHLGIKSKPMVDVNQRRKRLARYLFASHPGDNFVDFLKEQVAKLPVGKQKVMDEFYIQGLSQSLAEDINTDSDRVYRHLARRELKEMLADYDLEELIQKGVIDDKLGKSE